VNFSVARIAKPLPIRFQGELKDEVEKEDRKKMQLIDEFVRNEHLTENQKYAHQDYLRDYRELDEDLQYGVPKKEVTGLMRLSIGNMWQKVPDQYKQLFEQFKQSQGEKSPLPRQYSSPRLSRVQSILQETIPEERD